jgi:hypothetical protein
LTATESHTGKGAVKTSNIYVYLVFLLSPLMSLLLAFRNYRHVWSKNIVWLYSIFFGFTFVIGNTHSDVNRYKDQFREMINSGDTFALFIGKLVRESGGGSDYLQQIIFFIASNFTEDFRVVLAVMGFIFGFFYSRNIDTLFKCANYSLSRFAVLFVVVFSGLYTFWDINVLRYTIAAQMFFFGVSQYLLFKKKKPLIAAALAAMMHFSFVIALAVFVLYRLLGNRQKAFFILFVVSLFVSELNFEAIRQAARILPENFQTETNEYVNEGFAETREELNQSKNFRGRNYQIALKWATAILFIYIFVTGFFRKFQQLQLYNVYCFSLLFLGVFNVLANIPVMNRFLYVGYMFAMIVFFFYFLVNKKLYDHIVFFTVLPLFLFYFIVKVRVGFEFTGFVTVFGNPFTALFSEGDLPIINYFK